MTRIPFLRPHLPRVDAYLSSLRRIDESGIYSNYGPLAEEFQRRVRDEMFDGKGAAVTVANATLGLALALKVSARRKDGYVLMPSFTFPATPLAAQLAGFQPYFLDVNPDTWALDAANVRAVSRMLGNDVAAVVPYATFGNAIDLTEYSDLQASGLPVIVDAAASLGARDDRSFGSGFPGAVVFSMHATKPFGIGEGGLVYSEDEGLVGRVRTSANFGLDGNRSAVQWGMNAKLSEMACAVALAVLDHFADKTAKLISLYDEYQRSFRETGLLDRGYKLQTVRGTCAHQFMPVLVPDGNLASSLVPELQTHGVEARTYFSPACHQHPQFMSAPAAPLPVTNSLCERVLSLPLWEGMGADEVQLVTSVLAQRS